MMFFSLILIYYIYLLYSSFHIVFLRFDEIELAAAKATKLIPAIDRKPAKNPIMFPVILVVLQIAFIVLLGIHGEYGHEPLATANVAPEGSTVRSTITFTNGTTLYVEYATTAPHRGIGDLYSMFQDIHVMIFIGFGFLMTFLKRYG